MNVAALEYRLTTLNALLGVVEALRSLTAAKQQKALSLLPALEAYAGETTEALRLLAAASAVAKTGTTLLVLGPEGGFTGGLAGRIASMVPADAVPLVVGARMEAALRARRLPADVGLSIPASADALPVLAATLVARLRPDTLVGVIHPHGQSIIRTDLPPVPVAAGRHDLLTQLSDGDLLAAATRQDRGARLLRLLMQTHIAEQMARLATLTGARERIRDRIADLSVQLSTARQDGISQEIADLWAGRRATKH